MPNNEIPESHRDLLDAPFATLGTVDPQSPFRYLELSGDAEIAPDDDTAFAARAGAKYGQDVTEHDRPGERRVVVTVRPRRVYAADLRG
ncbi:MAG: hypothetical protein AB7O78_19310 [Thermoleophilia bacterium]